MRYRLFALGLSVLLGLCLVGAVVWIVPARANAPFTVNSTVDEIEAAPGDGNCISTPSGQCTLRAAIMEANALAGDDTITLPAGIYTLTLTGANEDAGLTGDLDITSTVTIEGAGAENTVIDANALDRVIQITGTVAVTLSNVTIKGGHPPAGIRDASSGGGIYQRDGTLTLMSASIISNTVENITGFEYINGGGLYSYTGTVVISGSLLADNHILDNHNANGGGGGFANSGGVVNIINSTIVSNTSDSLGGGLLIWGIANIISTTISDNQAHVTGGGIHNYGQLALTASVIAYNTALDGGGLMNYHQLVVTNTLVFGNGTAAFGHGGGLYNADTATIVRSALISNVAEVTGGGIHNQHILTVTDSVVSDNRAAAGAGIRNERQLAILNSTVSGNESTYQGGGILHGFVGGSFNVSAVLFNVTIAGNRADSQEGGVGDGGGIISDRPITLSNTLVANNTDFGGQAPDCSGSIISLDYNLIESTIGCSITGSTTHDIYGQDPLLGPLQDNGGPTFTHALLPGSPAIDTGNPAGCTDWLGMLLTIDQRGFLRPVDGGSGLARCDIGAYEYNPATEPTPTATLTVTIAPTATPTSTSTSTPTPTLTITATPTPTAATGPTVYQLYLPILRR